MTTTATITPVTRSRLTQHRDALVEPDVNLDAFAAHLRFLGNCPLDELGETDPIWQVTRLRTELQLAASLLHSTADAEVRAAPLSALAELLRDAMKTCAGPTCGESVAPWADAHCSPDCATEAFRAFGDSEVLR